MIICMYMVHRFIQRKRNIIGVKIPGSLKSFRFLFRSTYNWSGLSDRDPKFQVEMQGQANESSIQLAISSWLLLTEKVHFCGE